MNNVENVDWASQYASRRGNYVDFATRMRSLSIDLLKAADIDVIQVEARAKTVESFAEKVQRKGRGDADPFSTITDLVGLRVITYYLDDVDKVGEVLSREFDVDPENSSDKAETLGSDQFGYRSAHFIARLRRSRSELAEWAGFAGIPVEFQVRTSLQHAWAAVSHKLEYKAADEAPPALRRRLVRLSALFELADEQFATLRDERAATASAYAQDVSQGRLSEVPIDTSSIGAYSLLSEKMHRLRTLLKQHGWLLEDETPVDEERLARDRADLAKSLKDCGITTLAELDAYLADEARLSALMRVAKEMDTSTGDGYDLTTVSMDDALNELLLMDLDAIETVGGEIYNEVTLPLLSAVRARALEQGFSSYIVERPTAA